jgi:cbb3-type cytochrome oxidase subunit 3
LLGFDPNHAMARQKRVILLFLVILVSSAAGWVWIYSTAPISQKPTLLFLAISLFLFAFFGYAVLIVLYRTHNRKSEAHKEVAKTPAKAWKKRRL